MSMSVKQHGHRHELQARKLDDRADPTHTKTVRRLYAQKLRGAFERINAVIRESVGKQDVLGLRQDNQLTADIESPRDLSTVSEAEKLRRFEEWLKGAQESEVLDVISEGDNRFIQRTYERGVKDADKSLQKAGVSIDEADIGVILQAPVHERKIQALFERNFAALEDITGDVAEDVREELADSLAKGESPTKTARRLTNRVDVVGKTRATTLARTEVVRAHSEATLTRFEQMDVGTVTIRAEWSTAGDNRVCPICQSLEGRTWTTTQVREGSFTFEPSEGQPSHLKGDYPIQPPAHPLCRCVLLPVPT